MSKPREEIAWGSYELPDGSDLAACRWYDPGPVEVQAPRRCREPLPAATRGPDEIMTAQEAAAYLRLPSTKALYQRHARGQIKAFRLGPSPSSPLRFRRRDLDAAMRPVASRN